MSLIETAAAPPTVPVPAAAVLPGSPGRAYPCINRRQPSGAKSAFSIPLCVTRNCHVGWYHAFLVIAPAGGPCQTDLARSSHGAHEMGTAAVAATIFVMIAVQRSAWQRRCGTSDGDCRFL